MRAIDWCLTLNLVLMAGCFFTEKRVAEIGCEGVCKTEDQYRIKFESNINLDLLYGEKNDEKVVSPRLVCSLVDDVDFSVDHNLVKFFRGHFEVGSIKSNLEESQFNYESIGNFYISQDRGTSKRVIDDIDLIQILRLRTTISCRVVMTIYLRKPYYSTIMHIPTAEIVAEINR